MLTNVVIAGQLSDSGLVTRIGLACVEVTTTGSSAGHDERRRQPQLR